MAARTPADLPTLFATVHGRDESMKPNQPYIASGQRARTFSDGGGQLGLIPRLEQSVQRQVPVVDDGAANGEPNQELPPHGVRLELWRVTHH